VYLRVFKKINVHIFLAFVIIVAATALRVTLAILCWPAPDSDESFIDLMALHINKLGEHPIFYYGQHYMGTLEAYSGALLFYLFGYSIPIMRLGMISFFVIFLTGLYVLTSRLYSRRFALLTIAVLSLGTASMLQRQMKSIGGYTEILPLAVMILLISYKLAVLPEEASFLKKGVLYALWGCLVGLALWSDLLIAPYLLMAGICLVLFCWRDLLKWSVWLVLFGFAIGAFPLIFYNLTAAPGTDSLSTFFQQANVRAPNPDPFWLHILNTLLSNLPGITGLQPARMVLLWDSTAPDALFYKVTQLGWGIGYCLLLCLSVVLALVSLRQAHRLKLPREASVCAVLQLLLACGGLLSIVIFVKSSSAIVPSFGGSRYLVPLWISTPAVLWPLWNGVMRIKRFPKVQYLFRVFRISIIFMIFLGLITSMSYLFSEIPHAQQDNQARMLLVQKLENMHVTRFYSEYWTCARLIFDSQETLMCGDTWGNLTHGYDRYQPYLDAVQRAKNPAFVYPVGHASLAELHHALKTTHTPYRSTTYVGYVIIQPEHRIPGVQLYEPSKGLPV
jgi:hypothetical protein